VKGHSRRAGLRVVGGRAYRPALEAKRNPAMVCMELLKGLLQEMQTHGVVVLLCGVARISPEAPGSVWSSTAGCPRNRVFTETTGSDSRRCSGGGTATTCWEATCVQVSRRQEQEGDRGGWSYHDMRGRLTLSRRASLPVPAVWTARAGVLLFG